MINYPSLGKSNSNINDLESISTYYKNIPQNSKNSSENINDINFSEIFNLTGQVVKNNGNNFQTKQKSFDFNLLNNSGNNVKLIVKENISRNFNFDFTNKAQSNIINDIVCLYEEKNEDPLNKLFQHYNQSNPSQVNYK